MTTATVKTAKPAAVDYTALKLNAEATKVATAVGKALDKQQAGAAELLKAILSAGPKVSDDQLRAAVVQTYIARGNAEGTAKIRGSEAVKVRAQSKDIQPLVDEGKLGGLQAASKAAGNIANGKDWDIKAPSRQKSGAKTPSAPKGETVKGTAVPDSVTLSIAKSNLRDHVNRLKASAKDQAAAEWLGKVTDMLDLLS